MSRSVKRRNASAHEVKKVRRYGTEVVLIQPTSEDLEVMGRNLMSARAAPAGDRDRRADGRRAAAPARASGAARGLPKGEPHKIARPPGDPSTWPPLGESSAPPADEPPPPDSRRVA